MGLIKEFKHIANKVRRYKKAEAKMERLDVAIDFDVQ